VRKKLILITFGIVFGFLISELILRLIFPLTDIQATRGMYISDSTLAYRMRPNFSYLGESLNQFGFRGRNWDEDTEIRHIAFFGDSFTFGTGVDKYSSTFSKIIENELNKKNILDNKIEIINFGTPGYSTIQEKLLYENAKRSLFAKFNPEIVLLFFFLGNDAHDNATGNLFVQVIDGNLATYRPSWVRLKLDPFLGKLELYSWSRIIFRKLRSLWQKQHSKEEFNEVAQNDAFSMLRKDYVSRDPWKKGWLETAKTISLWKKSCDEDSKIFAIVMIPDLVQIDESLQLNIAKKNGISSEEYDTMLPNRKITEIANTNGIPYLDLTPEMKRCSEPSRLYIPLDGHFSEEGHKIISQPVENFIATIIRNK